MDAEQRAVLDARSKAEGVPVAELRFGGRGGGMRLVAAGGAPRLAKLPAEVVEAEDEVIEDAEWSLVTATDVESSDRGVVTATAVDDTTTMTRSRKTTDAVAEVRAAADAHAKAKASILADAVAAREAFVAAEAAYRKALVDAHEAGCSFGDIGSALGVARQSVRVLVKRAGERSS